MSKIAMITYSYTGTGCRLTKLPCAQQGRPAGNVLVALRLINDQPLHAPRLNRPFGMLSIGKQKRHIIRTKQ